MNPLKTLAILRVKEPFLILRPAHRRLIAGWLRQLAKEYEKAEHDDHAILTLEVREEQAGS